MALHVMDEANHCLGCKKPRCQQGCPIHTNIPEVIRLLKDNKLDDAGKMLSFVSGGAKVQVPRRGYNAGYLPQLRRDAPPCAGSFRWGAGASPSP